MKFPTVEHIMALEVAKVWKEKELITQEVIERNKEIATLK